MSTDNALKIINSNTRGDNCCSIYDGPDIDLTIPEVLSCFTLSEIENKNFFGRDILRLIDDHSGKLNVNSFYQIKSDMLDFCVDVFQGGEVASRLEVTKENLPKVFRLLKEIMSNLNIEFLVTFKDKAVTIPDLDFYIGKAGVK